VFRIALLVERYATIDRNTTRAFLGRSSRPSHGPELLIADTVFQTHTDMPIAASGPGPHTIVPGYVIYSGEGRGQLALRCLTVEFGLR